MGNEQEKGNINKSNSSKDFHKALKDQDIIKSIKKERNFKVEEKIDTSKPIKEILENNVPNFGNPEKKQFIDNQILIDYIIHEKYKYKKIEINIDNFDEIKPFKEFEEANTIMKKLIAFYNSRNCKVYLDDLIDPKTYYRLQKYYFNENAMKKKIRIHLDIDKALLKDEKKVKYIVEKIITKISDLTKIPKKDLYVTNVRKNCLIFDIYHVVRQFFGNVIHYFVGNFAQNFIEENENDLRNFFSSIYNEIGV